ncbi:GmrSD restriction endonuclease domain-containing protein [Hydrogenimonas sp.]
MNQGTSTPHYWFYKLEYLLWKVGNIEKSKYDYPFDEKEKFKYAKIKSDYRLTRLNSIEHMKPQSRADEWKEAKCNECDADRPIDCFGNLALISRHLNSALLADEENKKFIIQKQLNRGTIESLKMLDYYGNIRDSSDMTPKKCEDHHQRMVRLLTAHLKYGSRTPVRQSTTQPSSSSFSTDA